jgi:hypothetical protein
MQRKSRLRALRALAALAVFGLFFLSAAGALDAQQPLALRQPNAIADAVDALQIARPHDEQQHADLPASSGSSTQRRLLSWHWLSSRHRDSNTDNTLLVNGQRSRARSFAQDATTAAPAASAAAPVAAAAPAATAAPAPAAQTIVVSGGGSSSSDMMNNFFSSDLFYFILIVAGILILLLLLYCFREKLRPCISFVENACYQFFRLILLPFKYCLLLTRWLFYPFKQCTLYCYNGCYSFLYPATVKA